MALTKYFVGENPHYISQYGTDFTQEQINEINRKNEEKGYKERMCGYYDKWYRYNCLDNGAAYDRGCMRACENPKCPHEFNIIECLH